VSIRLPRSWRFFELDSNTISVPSTRMWPSTVRPCSPAGPSTRRSASPRRLCRSQGSSEEPRGASRDPPPGTRLWRIAVLRHRCWTTEAIRPIPRRFPPAGGGCGQVPLHVLGPGHAGPEPVLLHPGAQWFDLVARDADAYTAELVAAFAWDHARQQAVQRTNCFDRLTSCTKKTSPVIRSSPRCRFRL